MALSTHATPPMIFYKSLAQNPDSELTTTSALPITV